MSDKPQNEAIGTEAIEDRQPDSTAPFNLLFELIREDGYLPITLQIMNLLTPNYLKRFCLRAGMMVNRTQSSPTTKEQYRYLFHWSKYVYIEMSRSNRAKTLRDHIMNWRYKEIEALMRFDPEVLSIRLGYKMNRWQDASVERELNPLEYAWLAGDENLIELFEGLGEGHLDESCYQNKEALETESMTMRTTLSEALKVYGNGGDWDDLRPLWDAAPHWVYGLDLYIYEKGIRTEEEARSIDVFCEKFHSAAYPMIGRQCARFCAVYLSESHTRKTALTAESNVTESIMSCQIL